MITYAIGDVHGCLDQLKQVVSACLARDDRDRQFVFVGDYIDRGPYSKGVIDFIIALRKEYPVVTLRGNHEDMILNDWPNFLSNGGIATLASYGFEGSDYWKQEVRDLIPSEHWDFFKTTKLYHRDPLRTYVHAGIYRGRGGVEAQADTTLLWVRNEFLYDESPVGGFIVHGHTPGENGDQPLLKKNRLNLDSACVFGGRLTAAVFDDFVTEPISFVQSDRYSKNGPL